MLHDSLFVRPLLDDISIIKT